MAGDNAKEDPILYPRTGAARKAPKTKVLQDIEAAGAFLTQHEMAKIIVSIDTHCMEENGLLVWSEDKVLGVCTMKEVAIMSGSWWHAHTNVNNVWQIVTGCIPYTVYQYLTDDPKSRPHAHKSIILNLACGPTITMAESRSEIFNG